MMSLPRVRNRVETYFLSHLNICVTFLHLYLLPERLVVLALSSSSQSVEIHVVKPVPLTEYLGNCWKTSLNINQRA